MKENKKAKKVVALLLCAVLLVVGSVTGTMAYLTSQDSVTNTFTVGKVAITLDEAETDEYGVADGTNRTETGNSYKLIPGHTYTKDPIVYFKAGSEASYLFVKVENGIAGIETATAAGKIATQITTNDWDVLDETKYPGVYYRTQASNIADSAADIEIPVFNAFKIKEDVTDFTEYSDKKIIVTAYAIQSDGINTPEAAWTALNPTP